MPGAGRSPSSSWRVQGAGYVTTLNTRCSVLASNAITCAKQYTSCLCVLIQAQVYL